MSNQIARVLLAVFLSQSAASLAHAAEPSPQQGLTPASSDGMSCDSGNQSQSGFNQCASNGARSADAELNRVYQKILAANATDSAFIDKFKAAQRAWIVFRDAQLAARYPSPADYGNVLPMCENNELEQLTRSRIAQLEQWVNGTEEGDVCAGSYPMAETR